MTPRFEETSARLAAVTASPTRAGVDRWSSGRRRSEAHSASLARRQDPPDAACRTWDWRRTSAYNSPCPGAGCYVFGYSTPCGDQYGVHPTYRRRRVSRPCRRGTRRCRWRRDARRRGARCRRSRRPLTSLPCSKQILTASSASSLVPGFSPTCQCRRRLRPSSA